jgi:aminopeptidase
MEPQALTRYADAVVGTCLDIRSGETLLIDCEPAHRELAVALADAAYARGAVMVDVNYLDRYVQRARVATGPDAALGRLAAWQKARLRAATEPSAALVRIVGEEAPGLLGGLDTARVAADYANRARSARWFTKAVLEGRVRWSIAAWPTPAWARAVYPELAPTAALRRLGDDLLSFCRLGPDDPTDGWHRHAQTLERRATALTKRKLERLEFRGPGTELDITLTSDCRWLAAVERTIHGRRIYPNFPSEEVFTSPDPRGTSGTFRCTTPLSFSGRVIEEISGEFRRGRLVTIAAKRAADSDLLAATLATDRGAGRLGEVALVDKTSRIGQAGRTYGDTLLDENAAAHIAFGDGFGATRTDDGRINRSAVHLDVMIGSDAVAVTGIGSRGRRIPLLVDGEWQL